jgi:hypothetical protein
VRGSLADSTWGKSRGDGSWVRAPFMVLNFIPILAVDRCHPQPPNGAAPDTALSLSLSLSLSCRVYGRREVGARDESRPESRPESRQQMSNGNRIHRGNHRRRPRARMDGGLVVVVWLVGLEGSGVECGVRRGASWRGWLMVARHPLVDGPELAGRRPHSDYRTLDRWVLRPVSRSPQPLDSAPPSPNTISSASALPLLIPVTRSPTCARARRLSPPALSTHRLPSAKGGRGGRDGWAVGGGGSRERVVLPFSSALASSCLRLFGHPRTSHRGVSAPACPDGALGT